MTPKIVYNFEGEIGIEDLADGADPSDLVKLVEVDNNAKPKRKRKPLTQEEYERFNE